MKVKYARLRHARGKYNCQTRWENDFTRFLVPRNTEILYQMSDMVRPVLEGWLTGIWICGMTDEWQALLFPMSIRKEKEFCEFREKVKISNSDLGIISWYNGGRIYGYG